MFRLRWRLYRPPSREAAKLQEAATVCTRNIGDVRQAANDTGAAAKQSLGAAGDLSTRAELLSGEMEAFVSGVRAA